MDDGRSSGVKEQEAPEYLPTPTPDDLWFGTKPPHVAKGEGRRREGGEREERGRREGGKRGKSERRGGEGRGGEGRGGEERRGVHVVDSKRHT